jgi:hypothetical protein
MVSEVENTIWVYHKNIEIEIQNVLSALLSFSNENTLCVHIIVVSHFLGCNPGTPKRLGEFTVYKSYFNALYGDTKYSIHIKYYYN